MARLSSDERTELLSLLQALPELQEAEGRRQLLIAAGLAELLPRVNLQGEPVVVLSALIETLEGYGRVSNQHEALRLFLTAVQPLLAPADDQRRFLDRLLAAPGPMTLAREQPVRAANRSWTRRQQVFLLVLVLLVLTIAVWLLGFRRDGTPANPPGATPAPAGESHVLAGTVIDAVTRQPLSGVTVSIQGSADGAGQTPRTQTDAAGGFRFRDLPGPKKPVRVHAFKEGYDPSYTDAWLGSESHTIALEPKKP
jgi:hypothetical protein